MKLVILIAMLFNISGCFCLTANNWDSNSLISQKKTVQKQKISKDNTKKKPATGSCSIKKCSIA